MKIFLFLILSSTIFAVSAEPNILNYRNCSSINLKNADLTLALEDIPTEYSYSNKNYNFMTLPISSTDEKYCLIINNKNKVIIDAIPTMLQGMCGGKWDKKNEKPIWIADIGGGRGSLNYFNYYTADKLKKLKNSNSYEIKEIIESINCQLPTYTKIDVPELNDSAFYLYQLGFYKESLNILNHVIKLDSNRTVAYLNLADTYLALKNENQARKKYSIYYKKMEKSGLLNKIPNRIKKYL